MSSALAALECARCGRVVHPRRLLCPVCGGSRWIPHEIEVGIVEELTRSRRGARIATVRANDGPVVIARVHGGAKEGDSVALSRADDGAVIAG